MNEKKILLAQAIVLLGGTVFSWYHLLPMVSRFQSVYGTLFHFVGCTVPNPFLTPCLYGSVAFLIALLWSMSMYRYPGHARERRLRNFLLFCVAFGVVAVSYETAQFYHVIGGYSVSCDPGASPFATPCFFGTFFYIGAYVIAIVAARRLKPVISAPSAV